MESIDPLPFTVSEILFPSFCICLLFFVSAIITAWGKAFQLLSRNELADIKMESATTGSWLTRLTKKQPILRYSLTIANIVIRTIATLWVTYLVLHQTHGIEQVLIWLLVGFICICILSFFCEIVPKNIAASKKEQVLKIWVFFIQFIYWIFYPFARFACLFVKGQKAAFSGALSGEEYSDVIEMAEGGEDMETETQLLKGLVRFSDLDVKEVMKSRLDIVALEMNYPIDRVIEIAGKTGYSRIPVYEEIMDNVKGTLYVKDLLPHLKKCEDFKWQSLIRPAYFTPESKALSDLLNEFKQSKIHLAIVVDQYGGTSGLVTLEDILEEIVGEITDEYDHADNKFQKIGDNEYSFEAKTSLVDFCKIIGLNDDAVFDNIKGNSESLAGLILELEGEIPEKGKQIDFEQFTFQIEETDSRRIKRIRVRINEKENEE